MSVPTELVVAGPVPLRGRLCPPGDKSISHRALLFAALAEGPSALSHLAEGDDVARTRAALEALGVGVRAANGAQVVVSGAGFDGLREPEAVIDCGNSGTTIRLLSGVLAGRPFHSVLTGDASLRRRPMGRVVEPLRAMGARLDGRSGGELAPLSMRGGGLTGCRHDLAVASAQVKSALLLAGLQAAGSTEVREPSRSRDHTERMLASFGAPVAVDGDVVRVRAGCPEPFELEVPGDPSSAAFLVVGACITPGSDLVVADVAVNPTRIGFVDVLRRMGGRVELRVTGERAGEPVGDLVVRASPLRGTVIEGDEIPALIDEVPALAVAAAFADGTTEIRGAAELRVKESDRIGTLEQELRQMGVAVEARPDGFSVEGGRPRAAKLKSHGDHRIALAVAIAAGAADGESTVRGWRAVTASYPGFAVDFAALRGEG